ncbi:ComEC/Rec2 family competence protein [Candidatus Gottesmanbacteria bacterium]|nr:ComEC/Rec2 family competence protein [Candidatus Gottesmanbacteria bacterium]
MTVPTVLSLTQIINRLLPEPHAGLLVGLLFGTKSSLPPDFYDALVASGTLHIVALSGMNIAIMSRLVQMVLVGAIGRRASGVATIGFICWFVWFVGASPSIIRASLMGGVSLLAVLFGRQYWAIYAWSIAVVLMLFSRPQWLTDISFQLSALATLGIILFGGDPSAENNPGGKIIKWGSYIKKIVITDLRLTLAAQVFTVPIVFWNFHKVSLISPVANLLIGWVIGPLTGLGWITVLLSFFWFPLGYIVAWLDWVFLEYIVRTVYIMGSLPFSNIGL